MTTATQVTDTTQTGSEQEAAVETTEAASETAVEQTEEQKAEAAKAAEEAAKADMAAKAKRDEESTYKKINRKIKEERDARQAAEDARHAAEIKAAKLEGQLEILQQGKGGERKPDPNAPPVRPSMNDFETQAEFNEANTAYLEKRQDWLIEQDRAARKKEFDEVRRSVPTLSETPEQKAARETAKTISAAMEKVREELGDDAVEILTARPEDTDFRCTDLMRDTIFEKENSHKILGYAAEHPKVFAKIASMPAAAQVREIDKLAETLVVKKETRAVPPVTQVDGKGGGGKVDTSKMTDAEYYAYKRQQKINSA